MIKLKDIQSSAEILNRDIQALDILTSGMKDSLENKIAVATFIRVIMGQTDSIRKQLQKQIDGMNIPVKAMAAGEGFN